MERINGNIPVYPFYLKKKIKKKKATFYVVSTSNGVITQGLDEIMEGKAEAQR